MKERILNFNGIKIKYYYEENEYSFEFKNIEIGNEKFVDTFITADSLDKLDDKVYSKFNRKINNYIEKQKLFKKIIPTSIIGVLVILGIILFALCTYNIPNGSQAVLRNSFTGEARVETEPGFSTKIPWEDVQKISIAEQTYKREDNANTSDNVQLTYNFKVSYKITDVQKFWDKKYALDVDTQKVVINKETTKVLDKVSNKYEYDYIKGNIASIGDEMTSFANDALVDYGIEIIGIDIVDIAAPESIEKAINQKITKQQQAEASKYDVEKAQNEAEAQKAKQDTVSQEQQQMELCQNAIDAGNANSPSCYFGNKLYINASGSSK